MECTVHYGEDSAAPSLFVAFSPRRALRGGGISSASFPYAGAGNASVDPNSSREYLETPLVQIMSSKYEDDDVGYAEEQLDESDPLFWLQSLLVAARSGCIYQSR